MKIKKFLAYILFILIAANITLNISIIKAGAKGEPDLEIKAESYILIDSNSGQILYQYNAQSKRPIASTTKIMTALVVLEENDFKDKVKISKKAEITGESEIYLKENQEVSVKDLLYSLLLESANDASIALAEHVAGNVDNFVKKMNNKAKNIGATDTHFANPHGLPGEDHYSTAYDLAVISRFALKNPKFVKIVSTEFYNFKIDNRNISLENRNKLIGMVPYINGIKTGHTFSSGYCLVASAQKNNLNLISVVLKSPMEEVLFQNSREILDYGFENYKKTKVINKGEAYQKFKVPEFIDKYGFLVANNEFFLTTTGKDDKNVKIKIREPKKIKLPIKKGQKLAVAEIYYGQKLEGRVDLVTEKEYRKPNLKERIFIKLIKMMKYIKKIFS